MMTTMIRLLPISMALALVIQTSTVRHVHALGGAAGRSGVEPFTDVLVGRGRIAMPLGRIVLVRTDSSYCAIRFTNAYDGKIEGEYFAAYESWYQGDGTGDFSKTNVVFLKDDLWRKLPIGIGRMWLIKRDRDEIRCGPVTLKWWPFDAVSMVPKKIEKGSGGVDFAPTPWTSISEVNIHDPRIKWYHQDDQKEDLPDIRIPIDQLWK